MIHYAPPCQNRERQRPDQEVNEIMIEASERAYLRSELEPTESEQR